MRPADSFDPGHTPAQHARWPAVGNTFMSAPVSAMITSATRVDTPGMVVSTSRVRQKGSIDSSILAVKSPTMAVWASICFKYKGHLDLERHGGRAIAGVCTRVAQRILALTATIWHNDNLGRDIRRSLTAYDH